jgi:hypothetical protein
LIFTRRGIDIKEYPAVENHLLKYKDKLTPKPKQYRGNNWNGRKHGNYKWYEIQDSIDYYKEFEKPKIIYPNICKAPEFTIDTTGLYTNQKCFIISFDDKYLLGILNSCLMFYLFKKYLPKLRGDFYEPSYVYFKNFPIRTIDFNNPDEKSMHDRMVQLVERMLDLHKKKQQANADSEKGLFEHQIKATDREIDELVYKLYGLSEMEKVILNEK